MAEQIDGQLQELAEALDPSLRLARFTVSTEPWPQYLTDAGVTSYTDADGVQNITILFDRADRASDLDRP